MKIGEAMTAPHAGPPPLEALLAHRAWVRLVARRLARDDFAADDLAQDAWLAALTNPPQGPGLRAWLHRVLRNRSRETHRGDVRRTAREETSSRREPARSASALVAEAEAHRRVVAAVLSLPEPHRETVLLRFFEGLPPREIAERLGVPVETVRTRLKRAAELLRKSLGGEGDAWLGAIAPIAGGVAMKISKTSAIAAAAFLAAGTATVVVATRSTSTEAPAETKTAATAVARNRRGTRGAASKEASPADAADAPGSHTFPPPYEKKVFDDSTPIAHVDSPVVVDARKRAAKAAKTPPAPAKPEAPNLDGFGGSTADLLAFLAAKENPAHAHAGYVNDSAAFARLFVRERDGATLDPASIRRIDRVDDGARLFFPAGVTRWEVARTLGDPPGAKPFPQDLLVEGAGMDATLVVLSRPIQALGKVRGLTFRNLTIHCAGRDFLESCSTLDAGGSALVRLDHVRLVGFDDGRDAADSGALVRGNGAALLAEDSRIEAGFGADPGALWYFLGTSTYGVADDGGWNTLARFERCVFKGPFVKPKGPPVSVYLVNGPSAVVFEGCRMEGVLPRDRDAVERPDARPNWPAAYRAFENCTLVDAAGEEAPKRDVSELNPNWKIEK